MNHYVRPILVSRSLVNWKPHTSIAEPTPASHSIRIVECIARLCLLHPIATKKIWMLPQVKKWTHSTRRSFMDSFHFWQVLDGGKRFSPINLQKIAFGDLLSSIKLESPWTSSILLATECPFWWIWMSFLRMIWCTSESTASQVESAGKITTTKGRS